jgi:hypothetical protein
MRVKTQEGRLYRAIINNRCSKTDFRFQRWNLVAIIFGHLITFSGIIFAGCQLKKQLIHNDLMLYKSSVLESKTKAFEKVGTISATIVAKSDRDSTSIAQIEFEQFYWGTLPFLADSVAEESVKLFRNQLRHFNKNEISIDDLKRAEYIMMDDLKSSFDAYKNEVDGID